MNAREDVVAMTAFWATGTTASVMKSIIGRSKCGRRIKHRDLQSNY
jgi:hypothetical protein